MLVQSELSLAIRPRGRTSRSGRSRAARFGRTKDPRGGRTGVPAVTGTGQVWSCPDGVQGVSSGPSALRFVQAGGAVLCARVRRCPRGSPMPGAASTSDRAGATTAHRPRPDRCLSKSAGRGLGPERTWSQGGQTIRARSCGPGDRGRNRGMLASAPRWHGARDVGRPLRRIVIGSCASRPEI